MTVQPNNKNQETGAESIPLLNQIYFYLTEGCNLRCSHCWLSPKFDASGQHYPTLPVELFETAIREAKPLGLSSVKLTGGEPLLHPQFVKLLEIIRHHDLSLIIETNGLLCSPEIAAEIAKIPHPFVSVSIDGAEAATHERVRGVRGSFQQTQQAVRNLVAVNIRPQIIMSLMHCNVKQVDDVVRMAEELGASSVKFNIVQPTGRGETIHEDLQGVTVEELVTLGRYVDMELAAATKLSLFFDSPLVFRPLSRISDGDGCGTCGILSILGVIANGCYALCGIGEHVPELVFGRVEENSLEKIWRDNELLNRLRTGLPAQLQGVCRRCLMKSSCLGACLAQNYYRTHDLLAPFWFCEQAEEVGVFPETRLAMID